MTKIVGILNITPDSFSDGGKFFNQENALNQLEKMIENGVDMIDIGAESTRPGAVKIGFEEEIKRLEKVIKPIMQFVREAEKRLSRKIEISLDSYHFETIKWAFALGFNVVNDVSGLSDQRIIDFIAKNKIKTILMHNEKLFRDENLLLNSDISMMRQIFSWLKNKLDYLSKFGIEKSQLIFDPGIGFNKNAAQSIRILKNINEFKIFGLKIYVGHSKKRFLDEIYKNKTNEFIDNLLAEEKINYVALKQNQDKFSNQENNSNKTDKYWQEKQQNKENIIDLRAKKTLLVSNYLIKNQIDYLRIHDVLAHNSLKEHL